MSGQPPQQPDLLAAHRKQCPGQVGFHAPYRFQRVPEFGKLFQIVENGDQPSPHVLNGASLESQFPLATC